ncbi:Crp/Fnr family transcriptional regulator [Flavobacterium subsaxonicum]|uniref:Crp/Fnr family transcriptional regulator n=1 Tax=Flavobacterium subsaxonicum WB 4.1-42 = DSM 21790 TaxID=1121898 RepID=A0A0A2MGK3_9FLAO|nr:Crp/Fnr family transcriptional regulator [Flavobacterium subsaxonicum]KGO91424.1 Crp/Fnr family transcriptional regulator [Flavobacterium subsaxonicum WB 4.1-42 = DSM 21790]
MLTTLKQHIEQLVPLTDAEFAQIASFFTEKKFKKHQFLIQEGEAAPYEFFVVKGLVKAYHTDTDGKTHILQFGQEQWWITDYQAFYSGATATLAIDCIEDTHVLCITRANRELLCANQRKMEQFYLKKSSFGYMALQRRILSLLTTNAKERYEQLLLQYPGLINRVPKTLIAAYLGLSRETLSRLS